jgi:integrase
VAALIKDFTERHLRKRRDHPEYAERILQKELADWSHRDARTIKPREVIELLDAIVERPAPVMANRVAGLLSQMFRYGVHRQIVETSPIQLLFRPGGTERPRQRALDDQELVALLANVDEVTKRARRTGIAIQLILLTAVRRSELTGAHWSELDLEAKAPVWDIPAERTKTGIRPDIAERCLNHSQPGIIATYDSHHYLEEKRDALTQWADYLQALPYGK